MASFHLHDVLVVLTFISIPSYQFPDAFHATINGKSVTSLINDDAWIQNEFIPIVQVSIEQSYFQMPLLYKADINDAENVNMQQCLEQQQLLVDR